MNVKNVKVTFFKLLTCFIWIGKETMFFASTFLETVNQKVQQPCNTVNHLETYKCNVKVANTLLT